MIAAAAIISVRAAGLPACDPDNGGLKLPQGFCALVVADDLGAARHMVVMPNGDLYVATAGRSGDSRPASSACATRTATARWTSRERFGDKSTTGIALRNGYLYIATISSVERFKLTAGQLKPGAGRSRRRRSAGHASASGQGDRVRRQGLALRQHRRAVERLPAAGSTAEGAGTGSLSDCSRSSGGIWKFDENKLGQKQADGMRYATGLRQMPAHHLARRRALRGDEQPRSARHALAR